MTTLVDNEHISGFERHLRILQALSDISIKMYCRRVEEFIEWSCDNGNSDIKELTRKDIEKYLEWCFYNGNKNITRFTKLTALTKFFRYLVYENVIEKDITADIPKPKIWSKFIQKFTQPEILNFFAQIDISTEKGIRDVVIFILAVFGGLRVSEIINMTLNDVVDDGSSFSINVINSKHHGHRVVYFWKVPSDFIRQLLLVRLAYEAKGDSALIVSYSKSGKPKGRKLTAPAINNLLKKYAAEAHIRKPEIHMHMLRATHASDLRFIRGYDTPAIAERLGHKSIMTTDKYLPSRKRIHKVYPSLAVYWKDFARCWKGEMQDDPNIRSGSYDKDG